ncbi:sensor histidine kinase, partial [Streptomyces sp. NPDC006307]
MQRLYDFIRRHPTGVDSFWAVMLLGFSMLWVAQVPVGAEPALVAAGIVLLLCLSVALRRRAPEKMLLLVAGIGVAQLALDIATNPADFAMLVVIYTVAAQSDGPRWASRLALVGGVSAAPLAQLRWPVENVSTAGQVFFTVVLSVPFVLAWVLGDSMRTRRAYFEQLEERATRLEKEREAQA